ncbi:MAG: hypothetical protein QM586_18335 [Xenophilus sp.]
MKPVRAALRLAAMLFPGAASDVHAADIVATERAQASTAVGKDSSTCRSRDAAPKTLKRRLRFDGGKYPVPGDWAALN